MTSGINLGVAIEVVVAILLALTIVYCAILNRRLTRLRAEGISEEQFRTEIRNQMLMQRVRERDVDGRVKVSEADIDRYLKEQKRPGEAAAAAQRLRPMQKGFPREAFFMPEALSIVIAACAGCFLVSGLLMP